MTYLPEKFKIKEILSYTPDVKLFRIKSDLNPLPGQFIELSIPGIGECPLASCSYDKGSMDLLTRKAGNVTTKLFSYKEDDEVFIRGPYGKGFPIKKLKNKNIIMVAGGTGIAPVTSLISFIEKSRKDFKDIHIYFGFRSEDFILLKDKILNWKKKFNLTITLDKIENPKSKELDYKTGYIHEIMEHIDPKNTVAVLCGPEPMMESVTEKLNSFGIENNKIYWSMERRMECGFGSCGRCLIQDVYVCRDGPVFSYDFIKPKIDNEKSSNQLK